MESTTDRPPDGQGCPHGHPTNPDKAESTAHCPRHREGEPAPRARSIPPRVTLSAADWQARGPFLARLYEAHGPVVPALLGQAPVVFLLGPEANQAVLQSQRHSFSHRQGWEWYFGYPTEPPHLLTMDDPEHAWHRRLVHPAVAAHRLLGESTLIEQIVHSRLATWASRGVVDLYEEARVITLDVVAAVLLGLPSAADRALCRAVYLHGGHRRAAEFERLLHRLIVERRSHPTGEAPSKRGSMSGSVSSLDNVLSADDALSGPASSLGGASTASGVFPTHDALSLLARACDKDGRLLDEAQIRAHVDVLLIAGHETAASLAAWTFYLLLNHPEWTERIVGDSPAGQLVRSRGLSALDRVLREAERLYPPVQVAPRVVTSEVEVGGYKLPVGTRVFYSAAATHLLPNLWPAPLAFDPDRFARPREEHRQHPYALIGFGGGPRVCIGRALARLELGIFVTHALRRYRLTLLPDQTIIQRTGVTSRPARGIRVQASPRWPN